MLSDGFTVPFNACISLLSCCSIITESEENLSKKKHRILMDLVDLKSQHQQCS